MKIIGLSRAALVAFASASGLLIPIEAQAQADRPSEGLVGTWSGEYTCNQGRTGVTLTITRGAPEDVRAVFHFYEAPSNPGVPDGCFEMDGSYDPGSGGVQLNGGRWLLRPQGYVVVDFLGRLDAAAGRFEGRMDGPNCTTFRPKTDTIARIGAP